MIHRCRALADDSREHLLDVGGLAAGGPKIRVRGLRRRSEASGEEIDHTKNRNDFNKLISDNKFHKNNCSFACMTLYLMTVISEIRKKITIT